MNWRKSQLVSSQVHSWLVFVWDSWTVSLSLPPAASGCSPTISCFFNGTQVTWKLPEQLCRSLNFVLFFLLGSVWPWTLFWYLWSSFFHRSRDRLVRPPPPVSLCWLLLNQCPLQVFRGSVPWRLPPPSLDVVTDASSIGWGFVTGAHQSSQGHWQLSICLAHSTVREFTAVWLALQRIRLPQGLVIRLHLDCSNWGEEWVASVHGSLELVASVALLLSSQGLALCTFHIQGVSNILEDSLLLFIPLSTEWTVDAASFFWPCQTYWHPEVDLFASI